MATEKKKAELPPKKAVPTASLKPGSSVPDPVPTKSGKKTGPPRPCACGCGDMTGGGVFIAGHDSTLKSTFLKISREQVKLNTIPKLQQKMYNIWSGDKSRRIKEIALEVMG